MVTCLFDSTCALCPHNAVILFELMNSGYIYVKQQSILIATQAFELKLQRNVGTELTRESYRATELPSYRAISLSALPLKCNHPPWETSSYWGEQGEDDLE